MYSKYDKDPYQPKPFAKIIIKGWGEDDDDPLIQIPTSGVKWTTEDGNMYGTWQRGTDLTRLAFIWWIALLGQKRGPVGWIARKVGSKMRTLY